MANKSELHVGDHVSAARMSDKAIALKGKIVKIHDDSECVDIVADDNADFVETVHADDVIVLEAAKPKAAASSTNTSKSKDKD